MNDYELFGFLVGVSIPLIIIYKFIKWSFTDGGF